MIQITKSGDSSMHFSSTLAPLNLPLLPATCDTSAEAQNVNKHEKNRPTPGFVQGLVMSKWALRNELFISPYCTMHYNALKMTKKIGVLIDSVITRRETL